MKKKYFPYLLWLGMTLASMFFYPLFSSLRSEIWYLQWTRVHTYELLFSFLVFTEFFAFLFWRVFSHSNRYIIVGSLLLIGGIPFTSFFVQAIRQLGATNQLIALGTWSRNHFTFFVVICFILLVLFVVVVRYFPRRLATFFLSIILIISPINFIAIDSMIRISAHDTVLSISSVENAGAVSRRPIADTKNIIILLFDEMSRDYLYGGTREILPLFPNLRQLASVSDNFFKATAPSSETFKSIPQILLGTRDRSFVVRNADFVEQRTDGAEKAFSFSGEDNLFSRAKRFGFATALFGPYLAYCEMFKNDVDSCRSYSVYNYSTVRSSFSLYNPIATNIILWPRQRPQGWLKRIIYPQWQRLGIAQNERLVMEALHGDRPLFLFAHFYIPHLPFSFDGSGFHPAKDPFFQNDENYIKQLEYVDVLLGKFIDELKRLDKFNASTIVVLSDHNYRIMVSEAHQNEIPLMIKRVNQHTRRDIDEEARVEELLWNIF